MFHQRIPQLALILLIPTAQGASLQTHPLKQQRGHVDAVRQLGASHNSQHHNATIPRRGVQVTLEVRRADEIHNDVHSRPAGQLLDLTGPILGVVIEGFGYAELFFKEVDFFLGACSGVDGGGTFGLGELDAGDGDGRGTGVPEDGLALFEFTNQE